MQFDSDDRGVVARITGEIDLSNAASIGAALVDAVRNQEHRLILDMSEVEDLDSAGIQLIYQLRERLHARGQRLALVIPKSSPSHDALQLAEPDRARRRSPRPSGGRRRRRHVDLADGS